MKIILASQSPRRKELLSYIVRDFSIVVPDIDESVNSNENPLDYVNRVSLTKCKNVSELNNDAIVISADTSVVLGDLILGKPVDVNDSNRILKSLSGKRHTVFTSFSIHSPITRTIITKCCETSITFRALEDLEIEKYSLSGEGLDKAGAYGYQNSAISFISEIIGSPSNVIGLPLAELKLELDKIYSSQKPL